MVFATFLTPLFILKYNDDIKNGDLTEMTYKNLKALSNFLPAYIFNVESFMEKSRNVKKLLGEVDICFSVKSNPWLIEYADVFSKVEVCSPGELEICINKGIAPERIIMGGICQTAENFQKAVEYGVKRYSIESERQLDLLRNACFNAAFEAAVLLRLSNKNQFGMSKEQAREIFSKQAELTNIIIDGIHFYPGTGRMKKITLTKDFDYLISMLDELDSFKIRCLEIGSGVGVDLFGESDNHDLIAIVSEYLKILKNKYEVTYEGGRIFAAECGIYIAEIKEIRKNDDRIYYIVNGGKHQFSYYGQMFSSGKPTVTVISKTPFDKTMTVNIVGALCNEGDVLVKEIELPEAREGDFLVFHKVGAYSVTEGISLFLSRDLPSVIIERECEFYLQREKTEIHKLNMRRGKERRIGGI